MAISKAVLIATIFISLMMLLDQLHASQTDDVTASNGVSETAAKGPQIDCGIACAKRCELSRRPRLCKRACGTCCSRCRCVPPGTYGNYEACACYAEMTTRGNKRKCP